MNRRLENIASVHPTLPFSVAVSQRLFGCHGLFIPHPLTYLRLLDCMEVQRSSRHIEDHIESIQVLNCSSLDLHMLSVCVLTVYFGAPSMFITLWFGFDYGTNPPLGTLII
jgi:hypothetical protein